MYTLNSSSMLYILVWNREIVGHTKIPHHWYIWCASMHISKYRRMANPNKYSLSNCLNPKMMLKPIQTWENVDRGPVVNCGACDKLSKYQTQHPEFSSLTVYPWKRKKKKSLFTKQPIHWTIRGTFKLNQCILWDERKIKHQSI